MDILPLLSGDQPTLSFEFFPPKDQGGAEALLETVQELSVLDPAFVSVTYGAGGTTREQTRNVVQRIMGETGVPTVPHLTCIGHSKEEMTAILDGYAKDGVNTLLALRGDPPRNQPDYDRSQDDFQYARDLVAFIKDHPHPFTIGVAGFPEGHPNMPNRLVEMEHFQAKVDAGADYICTQLFFDNRDLYDYRERCSLVGIDLPIVAGVMPIMTQQSMTRMAELAAGSRFPAALLRPLLAAGDDAAAFRQEGINYATAQCQDLRKNGISGIHLYTLNKSKATKQIVEGLKA